MRFIRLLKEKLNVWGLMDVAPPPPSSRNEFPSVTLEVHESDVATSPSTNLNTATGDTVPAASEAQMMWLLLPLSVIGVSLAAISATLQALAAPRPLTTTSQIVYVALLASFSAFVVSVYVRAKYRTVSTAALHVGSFFGCIALVLTLAADLHTPFMFTCAAIVSSSALLIIFANFPFQ